MTKSNVREIDTMSVQEIVDTIGFSVVSVNEVDEHIFNRSVPRDEIERAFREADRRQQNLDENLLSSLVRGRNEYEKMRSQNPLLELLIRNEDKVDKEKMILLTLYNTQQYIEEESKKPEQKENVKRWSQAVSSAIRLIEKENITISNMEFKGETPRVHLINSNDVINCIKNKKSLNTLTDEPSQKQKKKFEKITEEVPLSSILGVLLYQNMQNTICNYPECGEPFIAVIVYKAVEDYKREHPDYEVDFTNKNEVFEIVSKTPRYNDIVFEALKENCKYINLDNLLLVLAQNMVMELETNTEHDFQEEEIRCIKETLISMSKNIHKKAQITFGNEDIQLTYDLEDLKSDLSRFGDGKYIKLDEITEVKRKLMSNEITLPKVSEDVLNCIGLSLEEISELSKNEENLIFFIDTGLITSRNMNKYIRPEIYSAPLFKSMIENKLLTYDDTMKLLESGTIETNYIENIENTEWLNQMNEEAKNQIRELSIKITSQDQKVTSEDMKKFNFYSSIYKQINIYGKSEEEIKSASNELIEGLEENISEEILKELYQYGIINLETAVDWGMDIEPMILNNTLKSSDFKDMYMKGIITKDRIKSILKGNSLSYEEKIDLIYSTFDGESEEEIKLVDELLEELGIQKDSSYEKTGEKRKKGEGKHFNKYVVDAHTRWRIISAGDKDYSRNFLPKDKTIMDGHRVFLLPNRNEVIIEKMHQKTKESKKDAYGYATYIMSSDAFFENIDVIIENGQVNRTALRKISEEGQAIKLNHDRSWGDTLKEHFEIDESQPELNAEIDSAIKKYRECKERI